MQILREVLLIEDRISKLLSTIKSVICQIKLFLLIKFERMGTI